MSSSSDDEDEWVPIVADAKKKRKKDKKKKKKKRSRSDSVDSHREKVGDSKDKDKDDKKKKKKRARSDSAVSQSSLPPQKLGQSKHNNTNHEPEEDAKPAAVDHGNKNNNHSDDGCRPIVESSNMDFADPHNADTQVTLLLFYQYQEPPWSEKEYKGVLQHAATLGEQAGITGRMRVAKEGFNCTLTGSRAAIVAFCVSLRAWKTELFRHTEFKLTNHLPTAQAFKDLKIIPVQELVHYGLEGSKAPRIADYHGQHLEPADYHKKMTEDNTVMIDVRNHYEAQIGRFDPPAAEWVDPQMRKSTEFPVWLDDPTTREKLRGKVSFGIVDVC